MRLTRRRDSPPGQLPAKLATPVLHVGGLYRASEKAVVERALSRQPGVRLVEANPVAQTATVAFDTGQTSISELRHCITECGYQCSGQSVPSHLCDPLAETDPVDAIAAPSRIQQRAAVAFGPAGFWAPTLASSRREPL